MAMTNHTITRTDVHSPANFKPENYEFVDAFDNSPEPGSALQGEADFVNDLINKVAAGGGRYANCSQCDHCGARIRYVGVFRHTPTGNHIAVGQVCTANRFPLSNIKFDQLRKQAQLDREAQRLLTAWNDYRAEHSGAVDWAKLDSSTNHFIVDVLSKGRQYGNLSDRQLEAIVKAYDRDNAPEAPPEIKGTIIEGRQIIEGTVVSCREKDSDFGPTWKITVKDDENRCYWGTLPKNLNIVDFSKTYLQANGATSDPQIHLNVRVRFTAAVTRSDRDRAFGFYKRPTKASIVTEGGDA